MRAIKNHRTFFLVFLFNTLFVQSSWFEIKNLETVLQLYPEIKYYPCFQPITFNFKQFPLSIDQSWHPASGYFKSTFILDIPYAIAQQWGFVFKNDCMVSELLWKGLSHNLRLAFNAAAEDIVPIVGRVLVLDVWPATNYWHWMTEVLCRLALTEISGVEYDYIYVSQSASFMKETLQMWGIDSEKIIASEKYSCIQASSLIVPSMVTNMNFPAVAGACYIQPHLLQYVKNRLLVGMQDYQSSTTFAPRIFISRKDAPQRKIINEDAVFVLLEKKGFKRFVLSDLSVKDQIQLFAQAKIIVCPQGTGMTNTLFCNKDVLIFELFQGLNDATFWFLSQWLGLSYQPIATTRFQKNYYKAWKDDTVMNLRLVQALVDKL